MHHAPLVPGSNVRIAHQFLLCVLKHCDVHHGSLSRSVRYSQVIYTDQRSQSMISSTSSKIMGCFEVNFVCVFACFLASWCWRCWLLTILSLYHFSTSGVETCFGTSIYQNFRWIWHCFHPCLWFLKVAVFARPLLMPWLDWFHCAWCLLTFAGRSPWHLSLSQHCLSIASDATSCWNWSFTSKLGSNPKKIQGWGHSWTITVVCVCKWFMISKSYSCHFRDNPMQCLYSLYLN